MTYSALIPHAGKMYAGTARKSAFARVAGTHPNNILYIIYIATMHIHRDSLSSTSPSPTLVHVDSNFPISSKELNDLTSSSDSPDRLSDNYNEHSFWWVEPELRQYFTRASILAIGPIASQVLGPGESSASWKHMADWIIHFCNLHRESVALFGTTDFIHHGKSYGFKLNNHGDNSGAPLKLAKMKMEEDLINCLLLKTHQSYETLNMNLNLNGKWRKLVCGAQAVLMLSYINNFLKLKGKVVDYYDSSELTSTTKYIIISQSQKSEFVSYASIVYGKKVNWKSIEAFDKRFAFGLMRSVLFQQIRNSSARHHQHSKNNIQFPKWSPFCSMTRGVFVGTSLNGKTNCSYGRYESDRHQNRRPISTAKMILQAISDCIKDAEYRWKLPITLQNIFRVKLKIELLDAKNTWRKFPGRLFTKIFQMNGKVGTFLKLSSGRGAATYLPVVAEENKKKWTALNYIQNLSIKAGGDDAKDAWSQEGSYVWLYSSTTFFSDR